MDDDYKLRLTTPIKLRVIKPKALEPKLLTNYSDFFTVSFDIYKWPRIEDMKVFKAGDHVVYVREGRASAYGVVSEVLPSGEGVMVTWDNSWDREVLGNKPFWNGYLELESDFERFVRESSA